jgi:hypothetical protein
MEPSEEGIIKDLFDYVRHEGIIHLAFLAGEVNP